MAGGVRGQFDYSGAPIVARRAPIGSEDVAIIAELRGKGRPWSFVANYLNRSQADCRAAFEAVERGEAATAAMVAAAGKAGPAALPAPALPETAFPETALPAPITARKRPAYERAELRILTVIAQAGPATCRELSDGFMQPHSLQLRLRALEEVGHAERRRGAGPDTGRKRPDLWSLTEAGRARKSQLEAD